jgi:hypothetical protein
MPESWTVRHFSLGNPKGPDQGDVPALLRRVAQDIEARGDIRIQDITFGNDEVTEDGVWPHVTVYFHYADDAEPRALRAVE